MRGTPGHGHRNMLEQRLVPGAAVDLSCVVRRMLGARGRRRLPAVARAFRGLSFGVPAHASDAGRRFGRPTARATPGADRTGLPPLRHVEVRSRAIRRRPVVVGVLVGGLGAGAACGTDADRSLRAAAVAVEHWRLDVAPAVDISGVTPGGELAFNHAADATRLSNGLIAVADRYANAVRFFDPAGRPLRTVGRDGEGPGEFRFPWWIAQCAADTLFVWDVALHRMTVIDSAGRVVRQFRVPASAAFLSCSRNGMVIGLSEPAMQPWARLSACITGRPSGSPTRVARTCSPWARCPTQRTARSARSRDSRSATIDFTSGLLSRPTWMSTPWTVGVRECCRSARRDGVRHAAITSGRSMLCWR